MNDHAGPERTGSLETGGVQERACVIAFHIWMLMYTKAHTSGFENSLPFCSLLESLVQSGLLPIFSKTRDLDWSINIPGPPKPDWTAKNQSRQVKISL